jgi:hypothetical protein
LAERVELVTHVGRLDERAGHHQARFDELVAKRELVLARHLRHPLDHPERDVLHAQRNK